MAETLTLEAAPRSAAGKANKALRRSGRVPLHLFGHGLESQALEADEHTLRQLIRRAGGTGLVSLKVEGSARNVMVRHVQRHPVSGNLIHVDLYQVRMDQKTRVRLPLQFTGEAPGVKMHDGMLLHQLEGVQIEALPGDIPHNLEVDLSVLAELEQAIYVRDLVVSDKVRVLDDPDEIVVKLQPPRRQEAVEAAATAEAPTAAAEGEAEAPTAASGDQPAADS